MLMMLRRLSRKGEEPEVEEEDKQMEVEEKKDEWAMELTDYLKIQTRRKFIETISPSLTLQMRWRGTSVRMVVG